MGFVNNSLFSLITSLNTSVLYSKSTGTAVFSKFNLKILLFLAARGFISSIKVFSSGSGSLISFQIRSVSQGSPVFHKVISPTINSGFFCKKQTKFCSYKDLQSLYSSEFVIVSTSRGLMTANEAAVLGIGGVVVLIIL